MMYQREGRRGEEKVGGIETKLQSFVSHRWKDGERGEEGGGGFRWKDTPEMGRCRECSSVARDLSCLRLAACVCVCIWGSQYYNACQHALPSSLQLCSARSFKENRKQTIYLLLCFSSMRQNDDVHIFIS